MIKKGNVLIVLSDRWINQTAFWSAEIGKKINDLLDYLNSDGGDYQAGLVKYNETTHDSDYICPLSSDFSAVRAVANNLSSHITTVEGSYFNNVTQSFHIASMQGFVRLMPPVTEGESEAESGRNILIYLTQLRLPDTNYTEMRRVLLETKTNNVELYKCQMIDEYNKKFKLWENNLVIELMANPITYASGIAFQRKAEVRAFTLWEMVSASVHLSNGQMLDGNRTLLKIGSFFSNGGIIKTTANKSVHANKHLIASESSYSLFGTPTPITGNSRISINGKPVLVSGDIGVDFSDMYEFTEILIGLSDKTNNLLYKEVAIETEGA